MSMEGKPPASPEKSLSYIAWSLKEISAEFKRLNNAIAENTSVLRQIAEGKGTPAQKYEQGEIPF